jgi:hypothetical protein
MKGKKYHVRLMEAEKKRLAEITKKGNHPARQIIIANILLQLDGNGTAKEIPEQKVIAKHCGCQVGLVHRVGKQYVREGIDRVLNRKMRQTPPVAPIATEVVEAKLIALCCGESSEGYIRRTLRLLGAMAVEMGVVEHISAPAAGNILKKT